MNETLLLIGFLSLTFTNVAVAVFYNPQIFKGNYKKFEDENERLKQRVKELEKVFRSERSFNEKVIAQSASIVGVFTTMQGTFPLTSYHLDAIEKSNKD